MFNLKSKILIITFTALCVFTSACGRMSLNEYPSISVDNSDASASITLNSNLLGDNTQLSDDTLLYLSNTTKDEVFILTSFETNSSGDSSLIANTLANSGYSDESNLNAQVSAVYTLINEANQVKHYSIITDDYICTFTAYDNESNFDYADQIISTVEIIQN